MLVADFPQLDPMHKTDHRNAGEYSIVSVSQDPVTVVAESGGYRLREVSKHQIRQWWPFVSEGAQAIKKKNTAAVRWDPEDVYLSLAKGASFLMIAEKDEEPVGFIVVAKDECPKELVERRMMVWLLYGKPGHWAKVGNALSKFLEDRAKGLGFDSLVIASSRKGYGAIAYGLGFTEDHTEYRKEL